jgi:hypothetical protein
MEVVVVHSCDDWMEGEPDTVCVCTEEVAKKCYGYPNDNEVYYFDVFDVKDTYTEDEVMDDYEDEDDYEQQLHDDCEEKDEV